MTMKKLYVDNLPDDATEEALRAHFATCGGVCDVEIRRDARGREPRARGFVTMTSQTYTDRARTVLDGTAFAGRLLHVSDIQHGKRDVVRPSARIKQQFRERHNMAYDLDCLGHPLTLRVFATDDGHFRVDACATEHVGDEVMHGFGSTKLEALGEALRCWNGGVTSRSAPVDAPAVIEAMRDVRAV